MPAPGHKLLPLSQRLSYSDSCRVGQAPGRTPPRRRLSPGPVSVDLAPGTMGRSCPRPERICRGRGDTPDGGPSDWACAGGWTGHEAGEFHRLVLHHRLTGPTSPWMYVDVSSPRSLVRS